MQAQHWSKFRTFGLVQPGLFAVNFCQIFGVNFGQIFQIALHEELWTWGADLVASAAHAHTDQRVARLHGVPDGGYWLAAHVAACTVSCNVYKPNRSCEAGHTKKGALCRLVDARGGDMQWVLWRGSQKSRGAAHRFSTSVTRADRFTRLTKKPKNEKSVHHLQKKPSRAALKAAAREAGHFVQLEPRFTQRCAWSRYALVHRSFSPDV